MNAADTLTVVTLYADVSRTYVYTMTTRWTRELDVDSPTISFDNRRTKSWCNTVEIRHTRRASLVRDDRVFSFFCPDRRKYGE